MVKTPTAVGSIGREPDSWSFDGAMASSSDGKLVGRQASSCFPLASSQGLLCEKPSSQASRTSSIGTASPNCWVPCSKCSTLSRVSTASSQGSMCEKPAASKASRTSSIGTASPKCWVPCSKCSRLSRVSIASSQSPMTCSMCITSCPTSSRKSPWGIVREKLSFFLGTPMRSSNDDPGRAQM